MRESATFWHKARTLWKPREFGARLHRCPLCGPGLLLRLAHDETAVRCLRCRASALHLSLVAVLRRVCPDLAQRRTLELSARGALACWLRPRVATFTGTEYFEGAQPGSWRDGIRCEDVQRLSFAAASFDLITHTEVFEHVADDAAGFAELHRVLAPGGMTVFTVPLLPAEPTRLRASLIDGEIRHQLPPIYHGDPLRGAAGRVLCFRDFGHDIVERLRNAGFARAWIVPAPERVWWGYGRPVIVAQRD